LVKRARPGDITAQIPPKGRLLKTAGRSPHRGRSTRDEYDNLGTDGATVGTIVLTAVNGDGLWVEIGRIIVSLTDLVGRSFTIDGAGRFLGAAGEETFLAYTPDFQYAGVTFDWAVSY
jgi:hypothetical protein